jgi:hypothetical protein
MDPILEHRESHIQTADGVPEDRRLTRWPLEEPINQHDQVKPLTTHRSSY